MEKSIKLTSLNRKEALRYLGYKKNEIKKVVGLVDKSLSIEEQVKESLKLLMK